MRTVTLLSLTAVLAASAALATPWYTQDPRTLKQGMWRLEEHFLFSRTDSALAGGDEVALSGVDSASSFTALTRLRYGIRDDLTVFVDVPWTTRRTHLTDGTVGSNDGLGDLFLLAKWKYHDDRRAKTRRAWALSVKGDTGETEGRPALLATGSGTTNWNLTHLWEKQTGRTTWYGNLTYGLTGRNHDTGVNPGDLTLFNVAAEHSLSTNWNLVGELNGRYQGHFDRAGSVPFGSSTILAISPGVQYNRVRQGRQTTFEAGVQLPVLTRGDQPSLPDYEIYVGGYTIF